ncbi:MAG TPA: 6-phosphogluconolactonase [Bacteroidota bacterium]|nr:6-phosphogluconolactonase [Bacteroidota bacterium]
MQRTMLTYNSLVELESAAAAEITRTIETAIRERQVCHCALSGGRSPQGVYRMLGSDPLKQRIDWKKVHIYFGDERCVPPTDPESNFGMAHSSLLSHVPVPKENIHRIHGEMQPGEAAALYARELTTYLPDLTFDLTLLGIGDDGHTASLFPGTDIVEETQQPVGAVFVPMLKAWRVSLTLPVINRSRSILFIVSGKSKAAVMQRLRKTPASSKEIPASLVRADAGGLLQFMCEAETLGATS